MLEQRNVGLLDPGEPVVARDEPADVGTADPAGTAILDAAASCIIDMGLDRMTITEIARRANLSRPTIYRRWPGVEAIAIALLTREILGVARAAPTHGGDREGLVTQAVAVAELAGSNELLEELLLASPHLFLTYTFQRLGSSQRALIDIIVEGLAHGQAHGSVRAGDPRQLAAMVLLTVQSTIQSAHMLEPILDAAALRTELAHLLNGYLKP